MWYSTNWVTKSYFLKLWWKWDSNPHEPFGSIDFLTTLCYHSQTETLFSYLSMRTRFYTDASVLSICCGLEYMFTILKFLQVSTKPHVYCLLRSHEPSSLFDNFNLGISYILSTHLWEFYPLKALHLNTLIILLWGWCSLLVAYPHLTWNSQFSTV